jgi:hypothetical protein
VLKTRLKKEGSQLATNCSQLKMLSADGKSYLTDVANTESLLRLVQSIPSPRAEPFKLWLAQVGYERLEENEDPELSIDRALETYLAKGYSKEWINQRLKSIEVRKELTDEWEKRGISKGQEFAILTDEIIHTRLGAAGLLTPNASLESVSKALKVTRVKSLIEFSRTVHAEMDALMALVRTGTKLETNATPRLQLFLLTTYLTYDRLTFP